MQQSHSCGWTGAWHSQQKHAHVLFAHLAEVVAVLPYERVVASMPLTLCGNHTERK